MSENNPLKNLVQTAIQIMVIKSLLPYILFFIALVLIFAGIQRCSIEQNDDMACQVTEEKVLEKLDLPYSAENTFTYSEIIYVETGRYLIYGSIETKYVNGKVEIRHFRSMVEANGNDKRDFRVFEFDFTEKNEK